MMDTSETYVKMCEKAVEIQELGRCLGDDYFVEKDSEFRLPLMMPCVLNYKESKKFEELYKRKILIWLPRQDQLQEMVASCEDYNGKFGHGMYLLRKMVDWNTSTDGWKSKVDASSMEQLWLAFVMEEKYGKTWNGEEWVKQGGAEVEQLKIHANKEAK